MCLKNLGRNNFKILFVKTKLPGSSMVFKILLWNIPTYKRVHIINTIYNFKWKSQDAKLYVQYDHYYI